MEIKIELPNNVKVTCPTAHAAITILRCMSFRMDNGSVVRDVTPLGWVASTGRPAEGEGWNSAANADDDETRARRESFDDYDANDAEYEQGVIDAQIVNHPADPPESNEELDEEDEFEERNPRVVVEGSLEDDEEEEENSESAYEPEDDEDPELEEGGRRKVNTRGRHRGTLDVENEESAFPHLGTAGDVYLPVGMGERTKAVFNFIKTRLVFTMKDVLKHAEEELGMKTNKKNKKKLRKSLKTIKKAGFIEKTAKREWRKVS